MKEKKIVPAICSFACFKNLADIEYDNYVQLNTWYTPSLLYSWRVKAKATTHFVLSCHFDNTNRSTLINDLSNTYSFLSTLNYNKFIDLLLHSNGKSTISVLQIYINTWCTTIAVFSFRLGVLQGYVLCPFSFR